MSRDKNSKIVARIKCCEFQKDKIFKRIIEGFPRQFMLSFLVINSSKKGKKKVEILRNSRDAHLNQAETRMESKRNWFICVFVCTKNLSKEHVQKILAWKRNSTFFLWSSVITSDHHIINPPLLVMILFLDPLDYETK